MRAGALDGLSIGFHAGKGRRDAATGIRRLEKVDLWEISVVTFPMLPGARVASVKARPFKAAAPTEREFERWLTRDAGLTRMEARAVLRSGFHGLKALRDAGRTFDDDAGLAVRSSGGTADFTGNASQLRNCHPADEPFGEAREPGQRELRWIPAFARFGRDDNVSCLSTP